MKKLCKQCHKVRDHAFRSLPKRKLQSMCRECKSTYNQQWYLVHKRRHKKHVKANKKIYRAENQKYVIEYIRTHPCVDCGEQDMVVLEFDHVRGKKIGNVSRMLDKYQPSAVVKEIAKCDVRCANCHRRKTAKTFGWYSGWAA